MSCSGYLLRGAVALAVFGAGLAASRTARADLVDAAEARGATTYGGGWAVSSPSTDPSDDGIAGATSYLYGAGGPYQYDCSHLVSAALVDVGLQAPGFYDTTEGLQAIYSTPDPYGCQRNDLIFFGYPAYHVSIATDSAADMYAAWAGWYGVNARNSTFMTGGSACMTVGNSDPPPAAPVNLWPNGFVGTGNPVTMSWTDNGYAINEHYVVVYIWYGYWAYYTAFYAGAASYTTQYLPDGYYFDWAVEAHNPDGWGPLSGWAGLYAY